jgi:dihydrofolate reductase
MRKLLVTEFVSLNGVMEAPGGEAGHPHTGWVGDYHDAGTLQYKQEELMECDALLLGRVTYESFAAAWPEREGEFADRFNAIRKYVVSSTLTAPLEWANSTLLEGDPVESVRQLKETEGGPIMLQGSAQLTHTLTDAGLIDEYRLMVFPVLIADGKRMFTGVDDKQPLELVRTQAFDSGAVVLNYERT